MSRIKRRIGVIAEWTFLIEVLANNNDEGLIVHFFSTLTYATLWKTCEIYHSKDFGSDFLIKKSGDEGIAFKLKNKRETTVLIFWPFLPGDKAYVLLVDYCGKLKGEEH